jgi:hypothetical protein
VFYGLFIGVVGAIGYSFTSKILNKSYVDKDIQTEAFPNLSDRPSQTIPENLSSIETLSPLSITFKDTSSLNPTTSEVGIQTIAGDVRSELASQIIAGDVTPVNKGVIPNPDIVGRLVDLSNAEYIAAKVEQLNALDPFLATP